MWGVHQEIMVVRAPVDLAVAFRGVPVEHFIITIESIEAVSSIGNLPPPLITSIANPSVGHCFVYEE